MPRLLLPALLPAVLFSAGAGAASPAPSRAPAAVAPAAAPGLVVVARTGVEDPGTLASAFRHAAAAQKSGHLPQVTVVVYGRAIQVFQPGLVAADDARAHLAAARAAGVRVLACRQALSRNGIPPEAATAAGAEVVDAAIDEIARLVAAGNALLPY